MYRNTVESKKTGPMIGMSPSPGIFTALNVFGLLSVSAYWPVMSALYRYPVRPRISVLSTTPRTTWSTVYAIANSASSTPTSDPAAAPQISPSHSDPVTDVAIAAQNAPSSSWPSIAMLITPEVEQITPVSAPSMIGIETLSVPDSRFTTLNEIDCPASDQASSETTKKNSTSPSMTRRSTRPMETTPSSASSRQPARSSVIAPPTKQAAAAETTRLGTVTLANWGVNENVASPWACTPKTRMSTSPNTAKVIGAANRPPRDTAPAPPAPGPGDSITGNRADCDVTRSTPWTWFRRPRLPAPRAVGKWPGPAAAPLRT